MPDTQSAPPGIGPALTTGHFPVQHYGVHLSPIGDDGDYVIFGHVDKRRAIAALNRHCRVDCGLANMVDGTPDWPLSDFIRHTWAVSITLCRRCRTSPTPGCLECESLASVGPHEFAIEVGDEHRRTPEAFPVTYWTS